MERAAAEKAAAERAAAEKAAAEKAAVSKPPTSLRYPSASTRAGLPDGNSADIGTGAVADTDLLGAEKLEDVVALRRDESEDTFIEMPVSKLPSSNATRLDPQMQAFLSELDKLAGFASGSYEEL